MSGLHYDKPMASEGLTSYRYFGRYGYIMIGAKSHDEALLEANRSLSYGKATLSNLDIWCREKYITAHKDNDPNGGQGHDLHLFSN